LCAAPIKVGLFALAVQTEPALLARCSGTVEDPVLRGAEAAENAGFHGFARSGAQVGFKGGEGIWRQCTALFKRQTYFIVPIQAVQGVRDQAGLFSLLRGSPLADGGFHGTDRRLFVVKATL